MNLLNYAQTGAPAKPYSKTGTINNSTAAVEVTPAASGRQNWLASVNISSKYTGAVAVSINSVTGTTSNAMWTFDVPGAAANSSAGVVASLTIPIAGTAGDSVVIALGAAVSADVKYVVIGFYN